MKAVFKLFSILAILTLLLTLVLQDVLPVKAVAPNQTISIVTHAPANAANGESFTVYATADSALDVSYNAVGACTNLGATFTMTSDSGDCTVQYDQAGGGGYDPAPQVTETVTAQPASTPTATANATETGTATPTETATESPTETMTATSTPTETATATTVPAASTFYVSTTGDDTNSCTGPNEPCLTINGALGKASAGNTINVATGTYKYAGTGTEIVLINKAITLLGGWDASFNTQNGTSTIDGENNYHRGMTVTAGINPVVLDYFTIQNADSGLSNSGTLTLNHAIARNNRNYGVVNSGTLTTLNSLLNNNKGSGITNYGMLTVEHSIFRNNSAYVAGGGVDNYYNSVAVITNSTIENNSGTYAAGGIQNHGTLTITNTTISQNSGGIRSNGTVTINSSTIIGNTNSGLYQEGGTVTVKNTIIAGNITSVARDCLGTINSAGYNLLGTTTGCLFLPTTGDLLDAIPGLGIFIGSPAYYSLLPTSLAIDAGNPATPGSGNNACPATDQRGITRTGPCDIGAFEYTTPGAPSSIILFDGTSQKTGPYLPFDKPLQVVVLDNLGSPIGGVSVSFTAAASGVSGIFSDSNTNTTTAITDSKGIATSSILTTNSLLGSYTVLATVDGVASPTLFELTSFALYVATNGNDSNNCTTTDTPCATINGAISKATDEDTIQIATGTYTSLDYRVVTLDKSVHLSGGWNESFTSQNGMTTVDGENKRNGIVSLNHLYNGYYIPVKASLDHFIIERAMFDGLGVHNTLTVNNSLIRNNIGSGVYNQGTVIINNTTISGNTTLKTPYLTYCGRGITTDSGNLTLNNSTVAGNSSNHTDCGYGGGIYSYNSTLTLNNTTVAYNSALTNAAGIYTYQSTVTLNNSIIAGNKTPGSSKDCYGTLAKVNYSLIGNTVGCVLPTITTGSLVNIDAKLGQMIGFPGYMPLLSNSPAIDTGDLATCLNTDQRNLPRPQGASCDMGSYEYKAPGPADTIHYLNGSDQSSEAGGIYLTKLIIYVTDIEGNPISNIPVTFVAPSSMASGKFSNTGSNTTTIMTNDSGIAAAPNFTANSTPGSYSVTATGAGVPGVVTFSLTNLPVPLTMLPGGNVANQTPTYQWSKVTGATQYQYEVRKNLTLLFTKTVSAAACKNTICSDQPTKKLRLGANQWRVKAMIGGVWQDFSPYKPFDVVFQTGFWHGPGIEFAVANTRTQLKNFTVYIYVWGCGPYKIVQTKPATITKNYFSFGYNSNLSANGTFTSPTSISGELKFFKFLLKGCGYISGGPFTWTASAGSANAENTALSTTYIQGEFKPTLVDPLATIPDDSSYIIERLTP